MAITLVATISGSNHWIGRKFPVESLKRKGYGSFRMKATRMLVLALGEMMLALAAAEEPSSPSTPEVFARVATIRIHSVDLEYCTTDELVGYLELIVPKLDKQKGTGWFILKAGFPSSIHEVKNDQGEIEIWHGCEGGKDFHAKDIALSQLWIELSKVYHVDFHETDVGMVITPSGVKPFPNSKAKTGKVFATHAHRAVKSETPGNKPGTKATPDLSPSTTPLK